MLRRSKQTFLLLILSFFALCCQSNVHTTAVMTQGRWWCGPALYHSGSDLQAVPSPITDIFKRTPDVMADEDVPAAC